MKAHHDPLLHAKLSQRPNLLDLTPDLYAHFSSSLRYSTQALPVNTLLDTLIRPNADTEANPQSCIEWRHEPGEAVTHVVLGNARRPGGQWAENPVSASWDIGTLSYAEMLSLPGYSYADHYLVANGEPMPDFQRPSRTQVADYYAAYPAAVGISDTIHTSVQVADVSRTRDGFVIGSHGIRCRHLVLASGIFSVNIPPPPLLTPLASLHSSTDPVLVIGSGFSAADVVLSTPPNRKIVHIYNWDPEHRPSPLRGCHHQAYPDYAGIYRRMKLAAVNSIKRRPATSPMARRKSNPFFNRRDWETVYEGLPNAKVLDVTTGENSATVHIQLESGEVVERVVGSLEYVVGRRGLLNYLSNDLRHEILEPSDLSEDSHRGPTLISGKTLRAKAESDLQVAPGVFIAGSLTGDSLVRHAFGGCVYAAGKITKAAHGTPDGCADEVAVMDGTAVPHTPTTSNRDGAKPLAPYANGMAHQDLHLDRRKLAKAVELSDMENRVWTDSGWWGPGCFIPR